MMSGSRKAMPRLNRRELIRGAAVSAAAVAGPAAALDERQEESPVNPRTAETPSTERVNLEAGPALMAPPPPTYAENPASDFMVDVLRQLELPYVALNPGSSFESLHESIVNYGSNRMPEVLTCLHEESAVAMGHGFAKITGRPIMALLHGTVGLMHASMAIYNAYADRVPVFVLVGNHQDPKGPINPVHSAQDMGGLVRDYVKWDFNSTTIEQFAAAAPRAYKIAMTPPMGPVAIVIDHDMQGRPLPANGKPYMPRLSMAAPPHGDLNAVRELARLLVEAERPLFVAERLARDSEAIDQMARLADLVHAPVNSLDRINISNRHPMHGNGGSRYRPDLIVGLEVNDMSAIARMARTLGAKSVSLSSIDVFHNTNTLDYGNYAECDLTIAGDGQTTLPHLIAEVERQMSAPRRRVARRRGEQIASAHADVWRQAREQARHGWNASPVSIPRLCAEIWDQIKNEDWSLASWQAFVSGWPSRLWDFSRHYHYIGGPGAGGIGYGAPAAVGAGLANRDAGRVTVNIQTDGDLNFAPGVLWTAAHHEIPVLNIMHNNRAYHAEVMYIQQNASRRKRGEKNAHIGTTLGNPDIDYKSLARAYGMYGEGPIDNPAELRSAIGRGLERVKAGEPALIDVVTQPR